MKFGIPIRQLIPITILSLGLSCSNNSQKTVNYLIFGWFNGECNEHCATMYKLDNKYLLKDTTDNYFKNRNKLDNGFFKGDTLGKIIFEEVKVFKEKLPSRLLTSRSQEFGDPDNRDQGGIYIQIQINNQVKIFTIDTDLDKIPNDLHEYVNTITKIAQNSLWKNDQ